MAGLVFIETGVHGGKLRILREMVSVFFILYRNVGLVCDSCGTLSPLGTNTKMNSCSRKFK